MKARKERADLGLVRRGLTPSREKAQALIMAGSVTTAGERVLKPGQLVGVDDELVLTAGLPYVGRGGMKLAEALQAFSLSVEGRTAVDLGASTGGFTDCLLQNGARRVTAVDVDIRQLDVSLRRDPRVVLLEKNARHLGPGDVQEQPDIVTADLSFISILKVLPAVKTFLGQGLLLVLLKPQFEASRRQVGKRGIVRDRRVHEEVLERIGREAASQGFGLLRLMRCSTRGQRGNQEYFGLWRLGPSTLSASQLANLIKEVVWKDGH